MRSGHTALAQPGPYDVVQCGLDMAHKGSKYPIAEVSGPQKHTLNGF